MGPFDTYVQLDIFKFLRPYHVWKICAYVNKDWCRTIICHKNELPKLLNMVEFRKQRDLITGYGHIEQFQQEVTLITEQVEKSNLQKGMQAEKNV
uniref:F-box domain-containing protein n=1 Tax=Ditylenchus dipsaci TaxID=166011 RepID=A0A915DCW3_9BILA